MSNLKVFESQTLISVMKERANDYRTLKDQLDSLKQAFAEIVQMEDFKGKTAEAIKGFYQAQIDVVEAWERFLDEHIRFLDDIDRAVYMPGLSDERLIHVPFLEDTLSNRARNSNQIVSEKEYELKKILHQIDDIIPLEVFSREEYDRQMHQAEKVRKDTIEKVYELDRQLVKEYQITESQENYTVRLFMELMAASRKNGSISAISFDSEAYHKSAIYQLKDEMDQQEKEYLDFKGQQDLTWYDALEEKELQNRPWYEKVWSGVLQGSGNAVGDTVEGIKVMAELFSPASIQQIINDPAGTLEKGYISTINMPKYICNAVNIAWDRDVIHGDAESRTAFFTYGLTSIGLSILGDKGISKIGNIAKLGNTAAKSADYIPRIHNSPELALAGGPAISKPVPFNVLDDKKLLTQINTEVNRVYGGNKGIDNPPKTRLPRTNGKWEGEPGNGKWYSEKPEVNNVTNGEGVEFTNGRPNFTPWSEGDIVFEEGKLTGTNNDFSLIYEKIQQQYNLPSKNAAKKLLKQAGVTPHHKSSTVIELIPTDLHSNVPHIGSASDLRGED